MKMSTTIRVEQEKYYEAKEILSLLGLSFSDGVNIFISKIAMARGLPFDVTLSKEEEEYSKEFLQSARNIESRKNLTRHDSPEALFRDLGI